MRAPASPDDAEMLAFDIVEGSTHNCFFRRGPVAAHLLATSGRAPRLIVAFPAGNTGAGLWFEALPEPAALHVARPPAAVLREGGLRGVSATLVCAAPELRLRSAVLGSVRALRRFGPDGAVPAELACSIDPGPPFALRRTTLDGRHRVELHLEPHDGAVVRAEPGGRVVLAASGRPLRFTVTALADDAPLTPIATRNLLRPGVSADPRALAALAFLAYEEKLLAGSWRFLTYFGRDTLLALRLLLPVLQPAVVEAGLRSVLDRLGPGGDVAHEEAIGDWAAFEHLSAGRRPADLREPILDDSMIDDDFLLAPVAAAYLLSIERDRARAFLAETSPTGEPYAGALARNLALVRRLGTPFAEAPGPAALLAIKEGRRVGDWRDSHEGLGLGRVPYGVNAALVPAALAAAARLHGSPLLGADAASAAHDLRLGRAFRGAGALFQVTLPADEARRRLLTYCASIDLDPAPALASLHGDLSFPAIALDDRGAPVPIMHSDDGFALLFGEPSAAELDETAGRLLRPFPAGLRTPLGMVVANPAFCADAPTRALFTAGHYHGTVIWSWQQAMMAAGLDRQLARGDLPPPTRARVVEARRALGEVIRASDAFRTSELWSFEHRDGRYQHVAFGAARSHHTESNAAQLWSTVYLALEA